MSDARDPGLVVLVVFDDLGVVLFYGGVACSEVVSDRVEDGLGREVFSCWVVLDFEGLVGFGVGDCLYLALDGFWEVALFGCGFDFFVTLLRSVDDSGGFVVSLDDLVDRMGAVDGVFEATNVVTVVGRCVWSWGWVALVIGCDDVMRFWVLGVINLVMIMTTLLVMIVSS